MEHQPTSDVLDSIPFIDEISYALFAFGGILVLGSYYRLGIRHTYLGTHFLFVFAVFVTLRKQATTLATSWTSA